MSFFASGSNPPLFQTPTAASRRSMFSSAGKHHGGGDLEKGGGEGASLLSEWNSYASRTASALGEMGTKVQQAGADGGAGVAGGLTAGLTGLTSGLGAGLNSLGSLSTASLTDSFSGMTGGSVTAAMSKMQSGVEGLGNSVVSGVSYAGTATVGGIQMAGSATVKGVKGAGSAVAAGAQNVGEGIQTFSTERLVLFFALLSMGSFLMGLAFVVGLPVMVIAPAKFAFSFTAGSLCNMGAVASLRGTQAYAAAMLTRERLPFSASYLSSMLATLWAALVYKSYVLTVAASVWQVVSLVYYIASSFPMGVAGMRMIANIVYTALRPVFLVVNQCCALTVKALQ